MIGTRLLKSQIVQHAFRNLHLLGTPSSKTCLDFNPAVWTECNRAVWPKWIEGGPRFVDATGNATPSRTVSSAKKAVTNCASGDVFMAGRAPSGAHSISENQPDGISYQAQQKHNEHTMFETEKQPCKKRTAQQTYGGKTYARRNPRRMDSSGRRTIISLITDLRSNNVLATESRCNHRRLRYLFCSRIRIMQQLVRYLLACPAARFLAACL